MKIKFPFRVQNVNDVIYSIEKYIIWDFAFQGTLIFINSHKFSISLIILFFILNYVSYRTKDLNKRISKLSIPIWGYYLAIVMTLILIFYTGNPQDFVYFQF